MPDYRCPACRGGFPAAAATDDACPWCGESMDSSDDDSDNGDHPFINPDPLPGVSPPRQADDLLDRLAGAEPDIPSRRPLTPFWDSGLRCGTASQSRMDAARERVGGSTSDDADGDTGATRRDALGSILSLSAGARGSRAFLEANTTANTDRPGDR